MKRKNNYAPQLPEKEINKICQELSNPKLPSVDHSCYQETEEWVIIERLLKELENSQDIEIRTSSEYVIDYIVKELRNKDLSLLLGKSEKLTKTSHRRNSSNLVKRQ